jgi:FkbH-like protein
LIQRSNQFNLTTRRYSEAECKALMEDEEHYFPFTISLQDRFGDFGLINIVILHFRLADRQLEIDTFLMSCRVLQRGVEQLAMNKIFDCARQGGYESVVGQYIPTAKNMMVKTFFEQFGFHRTAITAEGTTQWRLEADEYIAPKVYIEEPNAETISTPAILPI